MKRNIIATYCLCLFGSITFAQTCQKVDVAALISRLPQSYPNAQEAFKNTDNIESRFNPYAQEMSALVENIQQLNPVSVRQQQKAQAMGDKFERDGVKNMTDQQKIEYAKKQNLGGEGSGARIDFSQKMKDPEFRKKFEAMSPQEKMTYMQQQGVMQKPTTPAPSSNPMQADMQSLFQDPAFREKWAKMSQAEKQAYIDNYKKSKGYDESKRTAAQGQSNQSGGFGDMLDDTPASTPKVNNAADDAIIQTRVLANALLDMAKLCTSAVDQLRQTSQVSYNEQNAALEASLKKQITEGIAMAKSQGKTGQNWVYTNPQADHQIRLQYLTKPLDATNATLSSFGNEWNKRQAQLKILVAAYQAAMAKINYGESLYGDDSQFQNLATLAGQQGVIFAALKDIDDSFGQAAKIAADAQMKVNAENQVIIEKRALVQEGG